MSTTSSLARRWRKSHHSNGQGACVEVAGGEYIAVRDTKNRKGPELALSLANWKAFTRRVKNAR